MNPLDHILLSPRPLKLSAEHDKPDLSCVFGRESDGAVKIELPFVLRRTRPTIVGSTWPAFAALMQRFDLPVRAPVEDWQNLPVEDQPKRFGGCFADQGLVLDELSNCEFFELDLRLESQNAWCLRSELAATSAMSGLAETIRNVAPGIQVGATLPAGADSSDIQKCCEAGLEFVTVVEPEKITALGLSTLKTFRELNANVCVILEAQFNSADEIVKCLALGASAVSIDGLLAPLVEKSRQQSSDLASGLLSGIAAGSSPAKDLLRDVTLEITNLKERLVSSLGTCSAGSLAAFDASCLVATNSEIARIAGIQLLNA